MTEKWRQGWLNEKEGERYGQVLFRRATGNLPEMESSKVAVMRLKAIAKPNDHVLDVGCGAGHYLKSLKRALPVKFQYTGVDATPRYIELARQAFSDADNVRFEIGDVYQLPFEATSHDLVMSNNVLLHLPSIQKPLQELCRVARRYVLIRTLVGDRSFRIQEVHGPEEMYDEAGEPHAFNYFNIYSEAYLESLLAQIPRVQSWRISPDTDFDAIKITDAVKTQQDAPNVTKMIGNWQVNGYILLPWAFIEIEMADRG